MGGVGAEPGGPYAEFRVPDPLPPFKFVPMDGRNALRADTQRQRGE